MNRAKLGSVEPAPDQRAEIRHIAKELASLASTGQVLPGSIAERLTRCGRANCACHGDPPRRHGPYWHWTRKVANKTVGRWLNAEQAENYRLWVDNDRRIRELVTRLEAIGIAAAEADLRSTRRR
ncbi:MAG: hypothetical protein M0Z40_04410 [Actinomycetota bacterium]|jgi:hypothetical protein|nr:hypothetical protein [Actinomycetota bacterium]